ncbi:MAG: archaellin/type IV pilin N-terminal domain-containing protein [Thermofilum sp.]
MEVMRLTARRGISPVIATVILVAITIAVAIAVAFWMTGIVGLFTGAVEKLEIVSLYATPDGGWNVTIIVRNTGTTTTSIDQIFVNNIPISQCQGVNSNPNPTQQAIAINPGNQTTIRLTINQGATCGPITFRPGVSIEVKLHTTGGREYPKLTTLP